MILLIIYAETPSDGPAKNGRGNFVLLDGKTFKPKATWPATEQVNDCYDGADDNDDIDDDDDDNDGGAPDDLG